MSPSDLERLIRRDPAGRGLLSMPGADALCRDHLQQAGKELAESDAGVGIVTGFFVPDGDPPAAETDGLAGSVLLADVLRSLGRSAFLVTDELCVTAVVAAATAACGKAIEVLACPLDPSAAADWRSEFQENAMENMSHLIAVERVAPAYLSAELQGRPWCDEVSRDRFLSAVPANSQGRCHNMRGHDIHDFSAELYRLFEERPAGIRSIGIGDGGNEIGMGSIPWQVLAAAIPGEQAGRMACRTATDWTIVAGVSDWGAFALATAVCLARGDVSPLADWPAGRVERLLHAAVNGGPAVDGVTRRQEATVDGLPFMTFIQPLLQIRRELGLDDG